VRVYNACPAIKCVLPMRICNRIIYFFILASFIFQAKAQTYFFDNYSVEDKLANSKVYSILQDKNHLVWLGTPSGVSIFDGVSFKNKTVKDGLAEKGVWTIYQDSHGNIWFGHLDGGISRYNGKKFECIPVNIMESKTISSICENDKGQLWVTSDGSGAIQIYNPNAPIEKLKYEHYKGKRLSDRVFGCNFLSDKKNYFITDAGIKVFNPRENNFDNFNIEGMPRFFQITTLFEDKDQNLWFGTLHGGLYKFIKKENRFKVYDIRDGLSSNWITSITQDINGYIWVGTWNGITRIDYEKLQIYNSRNGLRTDIINCIIPDTEGNILIGTREHGLSIYKGEFVIFSGSEIFPELQVLSVLQDSYNNIWFGTKSGITVYSPSAPQKEQFKIYDGSNLSIPSKVRFLREDNNKNIWIGTEDNSLYSYNLKSKKFNTNPDIYDKFPRGNPRITAMEIDQKNYIWLGTLDWLLRYNIQTRDVTSYSQGDGLIGNDISAIYIDKKNTKYIGSRGKGITIFKDTLTPNSIKDTLLGNTTPKCITGDDLGNIWIGTDGQGVICYQNGIIKKKFRETDGLLSDIITLITIDNEGEIYVGTNLGLNKIDLKKNTIETFTKRNGFIGIQANENAGLKDSEGRLWFGTMNGAVLYNPKKNNLPAKQSLTQIRRLRVNLEDRPFQDNMKLGYKENAIIIDYASICLTNPEAVLYQVMLEGDDKDWQPITRETYAKYSALRPNNYTFKVRARNSFGIWNTQPATFSFRIGPPFYQTWWFISLSVLSGLIILIVYIKLRERALIKEKEVLEGKVRERTAEVVKVNSELAMKNKDITDSILYASRIQNALLPPELPIENTFVLFKPRDIVSGDFFWFMSDGDKHWIAAVDCTGHGVPGAFMSIIGFNSLNYIIKELGITQPSEILDKLDAEVSSTLHQYHTDDQVHDGMDIALVCYDSKNKLLEYSGAFNPLWIVRKGELIETRANRFAIGLTPDLEKGFTNHALSIEPGDVLYLFSDGYADQFGGPSGKKLKVGSFKELITEVHQYPVHEQKKMLEDYFQKWRGMYAQVDDVLVIGWKFEF
jgi:ligand-binding sensor domain-containing protein/serine phosphatase RsbU (regulator of sigma subunit)